MIVSEATAGNAPATEPKTDPDRKTVPGPVRQPKIDPAPAPGTKPIPMTPPPGQCPFMPQPDPDPCGNDASMPAGFRSL